MHLSAMNVSPCCCKCLSAVQDLDEGLAELDVEGGVDDRVDSAVQVAQPGHGTVERGRDAAAVAVGLQHVGEEEGKPANDEHAWSGGGGWGVADRESM